MTSSDDQPVDEVPTAVKVAKRSRWSGGVSRMWIVTLICIALAIGLTFYSLDAPGPKISIHFTEGHGIRPGDQIQHRGIEVGHVTKVTLNETLAGITVEVQLDDAAAGIASEGSRFWIVRPQIDLSGVSGLETAVGSKYIAVIPGETAVDRFEFDGLNARPPDALAESGIEIVLRGDDRFGLNPGAPIAFRGVEVGQVIKSRLSPDALHVDTSVRIRRPYHRLLSRESKFWVTSGIRLDLGVTGLEVTTGTLESIARGGIAFITPGPVADGSVAVRSGDLFRLHAEVDDEWINSASALNLLRTPPPHTVPCLVTWRETLLGIGREKQFHATATLVSGDGAPLALLPSDVTRPPQDAIEGSFHLSIMADGESPFELTASEEKVSDSQKWVLLEVPAEAASSGQTVAPTRFRQPVSPEDCFVVRHTVAGDEQQATMIETIGRHEISDAGDSWTTTVHDLDRDPWHGAPVISATDEKIIGILRVTDDGTEIAVINRAVGKRE